MKVPEFPLSLSCIYKLLAISLAVEAGVGMSRPAWNQLLLETSGP